MPISSLINSKMKVGCPHFKGEYRKYKQSNYNINRAINEFVDNAIGKCENIKINLNIRQKKLSQIIISDDIPTIEPSHFES